jgi:hypothetical protein
MEGRDVGVRMRLSCFDEMRRPARERRMREGRWRGRADGRGSRKRRESAVRSVGRKGESMDGARVEGAHSEDSIE